MIHAHLKISHRPFRTFLVVSRAFFAPHTRQPSLSAARYATTARLYRKEGFSRTCGVQLDTARGRGRAKRWSTNMSKILGPKCVPACPFHQGCSRLLRGCSELKKNGRNRRFYSFTDLRGRAARRGRDSRGSPNQVVAGCWKLQKL